jgi:hypothetical protein
MKKLAFATLLLTLTSMCVIAQPIQINQATIAASGNRSTGGFPFTITQPGSYILKGNIVVPLGGGIEIASDNVTIDLNGFTISGPVRCTGKGATLSCTGEPPLGVLCRANSNITVRNGSVVGFAVGVALLGTGNLVEGIHASGNSDVGISIEDGVVRRNTANLNGIGIVASTSTVTENLANSNQVYGLQISIGLYGSNTFFGNGTAPVLNSASVSQNNNSCNGAGC